MMEGWRRALSSEDACSLLAQALSALRPLTKEKTEPTMFTSLLFWSPYQQRMGMGGQDLYELRVLRVSEREVMTNGTKNCFLTAQPFFVTCMLRTNMYLERFRMFICVHSARHVFSTLAHAQWCLVQFV